MKQLLIALLLIAVVGCQEVTFEAATPLPREVPIANIPKSMRTKNWTSQTRAKFGQGSCVHASTYHVMKWQGEEEMAEKWKKKYSGGETSVSITRYLKAEGIPYVSTLNEQTYECSGDPAFLQWVSDTRRAAVIWWKPSHACNFVGFVEINGIMHAAVLDNNYPNQIEYYEARKFIKDWREKYGGFAFTITSPNSPPTAPLPWHAVKTNVETENFWNRRIF